MRFCQSQTALTQDRGDSLPSDADAELRRCKARERFLSREGLRLDLRPYDAGDLGSLSEPHRAVPLALRASPPPPERGVMDAEEASGLAQVTELGESQQASVLELSVSHSRE
jgi:hypothetical protein